MKKVIYTAIIGKYDSLRTIPEALRRGWEPRCFTDQALGADGWEVIEVDPMGMEDVALARKIKILSHYYLDDADLSIWIDGSLKVVGDLNDFVEKHGKEDFALFKHPRRNCVYEEIEACRKKGKAGPRELEIQRGVYRKMKVPAKDGLAMTGFLFRRKSARVMSLNQKWWSLTREFSTWRDQLTFPLACRQAGWKPEILDQRLAGGFFRQESSHEGIAAKGNKN